MKERWKPVAGYEGNYEVSSLGRVKSLRRKRKNCWGSESVTAERILKPVRTSKTNKYLIVCLCKESKTRNHTIHRLVLESFSGPCPEGMECCHLDGDPENNHLENLRWDTPKANARDRDFHGRTARGWKVSAGKTGAKIRQAICDLHDKCGYSVKDLSDIFHKKETTIQYLINHKPG